MSDAIVVVGSRSHFGLVATEGSGVVADHLASGSSMRRVLPAEGASQTRRRRTVAAILVSEATDKTSQKRADPINL